MMNIALLLAKPGNPSRLIARPWGVSPQTT
jgi:hypothetical protein